MSSLRTRLAVALLVTILPLIGVVGIALHVFVTSSLIARFDDRLTACAQALRNATKREDGRMEVVAYGDLLPEFYELQHLSGPDAGRDIMRSLSLGSARLAPAFPGEFSPRDIVLPNGDAGRELTMWFAATEDIEAESDSIVQPDDSTESGDPDVLLMVAESRSDLDATLRSFDVAIITGGLVLVVGIVSAVSIALSRGLRPVAALAAEVEAIDATTLSRHVDAASLPDELRPIATRTNELLGRLREAFARERRLTASAAHELRTPIAEILAVTELALSRERTGDEYRHSLADVLGAARRMHGSLDALLRLSRISSGRESPVVETLDVEALIRDAWDRVVASAQQQSSVSFSFDMVAPLQIRTDRGLVELIVSNLLANAAEYSRENTEIQSSVCRVGTSVEWRLTNSVDDQHRGHDSGATVHLGIGLPLVSAAAAAIGATFTHERRADRFVATVCWSDTVAAHA